MWWLISLGVIAAMVFAFRDGTRNFSPDEGAWKETYQLVVIGLGFHYFAIWGIYLMINY